MKTLDRQEAVLVGLLHCIGRKVVRTKFVKMTYLLDDLHYQQTGQSMTSFTYHWDRYGPNAVGNAIVDKLTNLSKRGAVLESQALTPFETYANYYQCADINAADLPLDEIDWVYIRGIAKRYGPMSRQQVVSESKKTLPMQGISQFEVLNFKSNPNDDKLKGSFLGDADFVAMTKEAMSLTQGDIDIEDLRLEVAKSARA